MQRVLAACDEMAAASQPFNAVLRAPHAAHATAAAHMRSQGRSEAGGKVRVESGSCHTRMPFARVPWPPPTSTIVKGSPLRLLEWWRMMNWAIA